MSSKGARTIAFTTRAEAKTLAADVFGVSRIEAEPQAVQKIVLQGLKLSKFKKVERLFGLSQVEMAQILQVHPRTLSRKATSRQPLSPEASDNAARVVRAFDRTVEVLGDRERALRWLGTPNDALGGELPRSWLATDAGTTEVLRVLGRLEHGVFS